MFILIGALALFYLAAVTLYYMAVGGVLFYEFIKAVFEALAEEGTS